MPGRGTFTIAPAPGITLTIWRGGPIATLSRAAPSARAFWVVEAGRFVGLVIGAPAIVNVEFNAMFATTGLAAGRPMFVVAPRPQEPPPAFPGL